MRGRSVFVRNAFVRAPSTLCVRNVDTQAVSEKRVERDKEVKARPLRLSQNIPAGDLHAPSNTAAHSFSFWQLIGSDQSCFFKERHPRWLIVHAAHQLSSDITLSQTKLLYLVIDGASAGATQRLKETVIVLV